MLSADIIHFALHSVANEISPMHSKLVLARDPTADPQVSDGSLEAGEIYRLHLPRTRLAVLSACQTGAERYYGGEGMISLARPFLAAGVPLVAVSLWPVDSESTAELMISFHRHRKQDNLSSAEALRQAQLDMLRRPEDRFNSACCWGAFVLIGGSTTF
jgi:CHAT domain-containing protein